MPLFWSRHDLTFGYILTLVTLWTYVLAGVFYKIRPWGFVWLIIKNTIFRRNRNPQNIRTDYIKFVNKFVFWCLCHRRFCSSVLCLGTSWPLSCQGGNMTLPYKQWVHDVQQCSATWTDCSAVVGFFLLPWSPNILIVCLSRLALNPTHPHEQYIPSPNLLPVEKQRKSMSAQRLLLQQVSIRL